MVIDNLDIRDVAIGPDKADTELIVDTDRVLALTVPFERFERQSTPERVVAPLVAKGILSDYAHLPRKGAHRNRRDPEPRDFDRFA